MVQVVQASDLYLTLKSCFCELYLSVALNHLEKHLPFLFTHFLGVSIHFTVNSKSKRADDAETAFFCPPSLHTRAEFWVSRLQKVSVKDLVASLQNFWGQLRSLRSGAWWEEVRP